MTRYFGQKPEWIENRNFNDREALAQSGIHRPRQAGISFSANEGADSIVLSGGYADDEDHGDVIIYTGMGGRDPNSGKQTSDQKLELGNKALAINKNEGLPTRVSRGSGHLSPFSPTAGYTYGGLYFVDDYWHEKRKHGFLIWRFRLIKVTELLPDNQIPVTRNSTALPATQRQSVTIQKLLRDSAVARRVKKLHQYSCQVCGLTIETPAGPYSEAAHIRPLGRPHDGPDVGENVLCLCPNHHVLFDSGAFGIADDLSLIGLAGGLRTQRRHKIDVAFLQYHRGHYGLA